MKNEDRENVIEWITGDKEIACTFTQKKWITKVKKLREQSSENVPVFVENADGSIFCHLPITMLKLIPKRKVELSEERKAELREKMLEVRTMRGGTNE